MFYTEDIDLKTLRFGDVVQGFIEAVPIIREPLKDSILSGYKCDLKIHNPVFSVVMTPCCSIGQNTLSLAPLRKITSDIFKNRHQKIIEDPTLLNNKIKKKDLISPEIWTNRLSEEKREEFESEEKKYAYKDLFFYEKYDVLFDEYDVTVRYSKNRKDIFRTKYYMVDFKSISQTRCNKIIKDHIHDDILKAKCLELTINAREEFRGKIALYYGRTPKEDIV